MPPVIRVPRQLILLPLPVTAGQKQLKLAYLTANLTQYSLDQIAEQELDKIYAWPLMANSRLKRLYRNYTLVYTRAELKNLLLLSYQDILGPGFFEEPSVPEEVFDEAEPPVPEETIDEAEPMNNWIPKVALYHNDFDSWDKGNNADTGLQFDVLGTWGPSSLEDTMNDVLSWGFEFDFGAYERGEYDAIAFSDVFEGKDSPY